MYNVNVAVPANGVSGVGLLRAAGLKYIKSIFATLASSLEQHRCFIPPITLASDVSLEKNSVAFASFMSRGHNIKYALYDNIVATTLPPM
jgi:hypothetical protein